MMLRRWQSECIALARHQYRAGQSHFLALATPGAGKTKMASSLAKQLLDDGLVDLVICFAPSVIVADDFREALESETGYRMDGLMGSRGTTLTYQAMLSVSDYFWALFSQHRVFAIFDEIHHCAGHTAETANAWGERIMCEIQGRAAYTLALTGTPWRSDRIPIVLSRYCGEQRQIHCDYQYGLQQSIVDRVCRTPHLIVIDNDNITVNEGHTSKQFNSIEALLSQSCCTYQQLLDNEVLIAYILRQADKKLNTIRKSVPNAGGLIVAASVTHAHQIARLLKKILNEHAAIATYYEDDAAYIIRDFKAGMQKWIISVGMISEGTNIPRLHVCCHLTRVKTELYFRQVLGRILRSSGEEGESAYLYMPAEPTLTQYAQRLAEDIPSMEVLKFERMKQHGGVNKTTSATNPTSSAQPLNLTINTDYFPPVNDLIAPNDSAAPQNASDEYSLAQSYESTLNLFGRFKQEILSLDMLRFDQARSLLSSGPMR